MGACTQLEMMTKEDFEVRRPTLSFSFLSNSVCSFLESQMGVLDSKV